MNALPLRVIGLLGDVSEGHQAPRDRYRADAMLAESVPFTLRECDRDDREQFLLLLIAVTDQRRHHRVDAGRHPLARGGVRAHRPRRQLRVDGHDGVVDLSVLGIHSVHQLRVERTSLAEQGKEQQVLAGVVRVQEVQHLSGVRADDLGSRRVIGRGAEQSG